MSSNNHNHTHSHSHDHGHSHSHDHGHGHSHGGVRRWMPSIISFVMLAAGMTAGYAHLPLFEDNTVRLIWYIIAFLPVGIPVVKESIEGWMARDWFNEFTLMTVACIGAFCIGEYPEAVGVMLFYSIGETLQDLAVGRATGSITRLLDMRSRHARVLRDGGWVDVDPEKVKVGETIEVLPGQRVPLDGELLSDDGVFDTSALTGESVPRTVEKGGEVLSGMIATGSSVRLKVSREYSQGAVARILAMVRDASSRKAHSELFIRRFARIYTPTVIALAVLVVAVPAIVALINPGFHYDFDTWLYRALVFLVISCPCALVISVPLAYFAGIGAASRDGILFKGGNYLEAITRVNTVAFDKTGTLTTGKFGVTAVLPDGVEPKRLLALAAAVERSSTHPLAKALVEYADANTSERPEARDMRERPGYGASAEVDGHRVLAGNLRYLNREGVAGTEHCTADAATLIAVAIDGRYAGCVTLADTVKSDAAKAIADLHSLGITKTVMLSGDRDDLTQRVARELGVSEAHGNLLPQDKAKYVEEEASRPGTTVAFVGDGMNDAPVLAISDVGIAMGGLGSDAAIESADIVIQTDRPSRVATAVRIGRATKAIVTENIVGAIGIKVLIMVLSLFGIASLWGAVFADVGVALLAVLNSMRLMGRPWKNY